ncbi:hypothetical protein HN51_000720 [Arachis hypogaea]|nr:uncharacterized protein DS421_1g07630 [Arachis hypogaea]QHO48700.1 uncharacterized protein DS421_1g07630 [Arachis hypogaea]
MAKSSMKLAFWILLFVCISVEVARIEARGPFECPRMINCESVCQGFPSCCINGKCICQKCPSQKTEDDYQPLQDTTKPNSQLN